MTKKYFIIGNPVEHSLSPKIHNFWFKQNNIDATYEKKEISESELPEVVKDIRDDKIYGINVTVPFKQKIIPFLDKLSDLAKKTESVNTVYKIDNQVVGDNTDVYGFKMSLINQNIELKDKIAFIIGAGGVVPSIITALKDLSIKKIFLTNRTFSKIEKLKIKYPELQLLKWGEITNFDIVINATSVGLNFEDKIDINFKNLKDHKIFYDTIYNPPMTNFLSEAKSCGHNFLNGKLMLVYQAQKAFQNWNNLLPNLDKQFFDFIKDD